ncbi:Ldh family oxidoreductase [Methanobrevibacter sp. OttesenSCG-928-K11]|nr:Ldh family oxidoreductase [Methanobrevibacter sp. OttesenSCG-928-K11]MDL2271120.1 Ldh family oxidoreductase [Methanobrevibacter sp. OttesenSCG-928-I08]
MKITEQKEYALVKEILSKLGASEEDCKIVAEATLDADLKGFTSHGLGRFPQYIKGIELKTISLEDNITIEKETPAIALINGNSGFGQAIAYKAMKLAIKKAKEIGIGCVGTHNGNHFGVTGYYSDLAIREDVIGLVIANTDPGVAPLGASKPVLGTNPVSIGIPSSDTYIALDMATSESARGKLLEAKRKGEEIPPNVALDKDGNPTTNPEEALKGSILPFGAHKGYGLSFMIELLAGPLVGAAYGSNVTGTAGTDVDCTKGDLFLAIDPSKFVDFETFEEQVEDFVSEVRSAGNTFVPGDLEVKRVAEAQENGMTIDPNLYTQLKDICDNLDINIDEYITK